MTQEPDPVAQLHAAVAKARGLKMSVNSLLKGARLSVSANTLYTWLRGEREPKARALATVIGEIERHVAAERRRMKAGLLTQGGAYRISEDGTPRVERDGAAIRLKDPQHRVLWAIKRARGPAFIDWICEETGLKKGQVYKAVSDLRPLLERIDLEIVTYSARGGEESSYGLSDRAAAGVAA